MALIDPAPGRVEAFRVGQAHLILLEGDLVETQFEQARHATLSDGVSVMIPASVTADFGEVTIVFHDVDTG